MRTAVLDRRPSTPTSGHARASRRACLAALAAAGSLLAGAFAPAASSAATGRYVALGDSFTSGPLIPEQVSPLGCLRSNHNYPSLVRAAIGASSFRDASCQGAATVNMTQPEPVRLGTNPPQFDALTAATSVVTIGIGGNDALDFLTVLAVCAGFSLTNPFGSPCKDHYTAGGTDRLARAIANAAPKVAAVLRGIHARSPLARVFVVGYPVILPASGYGCWPLVPIAFGDVTYLRGLELKLDNMLAATAAAGHATYVNTYSDSVGHDVCKAPGVKWVEGLVPTSLAAPFHPNALGEKAMARQVIAAIG